MKTAAIYLRVSRADQNTAPQADATAELVTRREWKLAATYSDEGFSGSHARRPGFRQMLEDARRRRFSVLVVWRADRLFRSLRELVVTLQELDELGISFVSVTEPFDTTTSAGKLLLHVVAAMAEFERNLIIERTKAGIAAARRRGRVPGRRRVVDVDQARRLKASGLSYAKVAEQLGVGVASVHRALSSRAGTRAGRAGAE